MSIKDVPIWTPLAAFLLGLAWLLPNSSPPWIAFHKDLMAAGVVAMVAFGVTFQCWRNEQKFFIDGMSVALAIISFYCLVQWLFGRVYFFGHSAVGFGYFFAASCALVIGRFWEDGSPRVVGNFVFSAVVIGAVGTAGVILKQWLGVEGLEVWMQIIPAGSRPFGNLMQPNNAGTLILLGLVGLFWGVVQNRIAMLVGVFSGVFLIHSLVLTQSRIGFLSFFVLCVAGLVVLFRRRERRSWSCILFLWLGAFFVFLWLLPDFSNWLGLSFNDSIAVRTRGELRGLLYQAFFSASFVEPLWGFGFGQGAYAQLAAAHNGTELPGLFSWTHNLFLDLLIWFGFPVVLLFVGMALWALLRISKAKQDVHGLLYLGAGFVLLMHSMVELPHAYAYFLLPGCMILGAVSSRANLPCFSVDPKPIAMALAMLVGLLGVIAYDYIRVESAFYSWRFKLARVGLNHPMHVPNTILLNQFQSLLVGVRSSAGGLDAPTLHSFEKAVFLEPSPAAIQALVVALVDVGNIKRAQLVVDQTSLLSSPEYRKALADSWQVRAAHAPKYGAVLWQE